MARRPTGSRGSGRPCAKRIPGAVLCAPLWPKEARERGTIPVNAPHPPDETRHDEARKERAALWSIAASAGITLAQGAAGFATGSLALISDAAQSLLDVDSTTMTWLAVRASHKPADAEHQYGHGKVQSLAALAQTAFLFLLSGAVAYEGVRRLAEGEFEVEPSWTAVGVLVMSIGVDAWRWW